MLIALSDVNMVTSMNPVRARARLSDTRRIAVLRALQLGDMLCALPALRSLREAFPDAHITLIGLPWSTEFARRIPELVNELLPLPGFPGLPEHPFEARQFRDFLAKAQERRFDLAIQMHGSGSITNSLLMLLGARNNAGFFSEELYCPDPELFLEYPSGEPEIWKLLRLVQHLGIPVATERPELRPLTDDLRRLDELLTAHDVAPYAQIVCLHPGARAESRRWEAARFAAVADTLVRRGFPVLLTGSADEREVVRAVTAAMEERSVDLSGKTDLGTLSALLSRARLLICNDTGVSHLAVALQTPSVVVFTRAETLGWPPLDRLRHRVVARIGGVEPEQVLEQAADLLEEKGVACAA